MDQSNTGLFKQGKDRVLEWQSASRAPLRLQR
jgi:hypothetical protein